MDTNDTAYWDGKEPKDSAELNEQVQSAVRAIQQWKDAANISRTEDGVMIDAQIFWLKQLLKLARIGLISEDASNSK